MREVDEQTKIKNRDLCERYPFLIPYSQRERILGTESEDGWFWAGGPEVVPEYDYEYTELDSMPLGWRLAFGEQMCEELKNAILMDGGKDALNEYCIVQIKEKWGRLNWYDMGNTSHGYDVVGKYQDISKTTCIRCGKPAAWISKGWISPFCDDCAKETCLGWPEQFSPIEEFYVPQ